MEELMDGVSLQKTLFLFVLLDVSVVCPRVVFKTLFLFVLLDVSVVCPRVVFRVLVAQWLRRLVYTEKIMSSNLIENTFFFERRCSDTRGAAISLGV